MCINMEILKKRPDTTLRGTWEHLILIPHSFYSFMHTFILLWWHNYIVNYSTYAPPPIFGDFT